MKVRLIDTLRTKIKNFASTVSLSGGSKVVILDEADYISADSVQPALRNFIEEFSSNCRFIFTCNYKNRIIHHFIQEQLLLIFNDTIRQTTLAMHSSQDSKRFVILKVLNMMREFGRTHHEVLP